ncbi:MAG: hypothetical protein KJZ84_18005 [Bryobacteraceae bacterium]|nr:hypothetical protein [Bryobacteraceae bacterium]
MKFLYKIWSGFDGFQPRRIGERLVNGKDLALSWKRYIDAVDVGDEVWVYFHGPHRFTPGVYANGFVSEIDVGSSLVRLRVRKYTETQPLTDPDTSERIGRTVSTRNRQVFLFPEEWDSAPQCSLHGGATSCAKRLCGTCLTWRGLPLIKKNGLALPPRLRDQRLSACVPAYWVIPSRCYLHKLGSVTRSVQQTSDMFYRFKVGEEALAYPLALGMYTRLAQLATVDFDAIVPIPLSPEKAASGEIHRTKLLSKELARLLSTRLVEALALRHPISKKRLRTQGGMSTSGFEAKYIGALKVTARLSQFSRILLVDDVCTEGSTLRATASKLRQENRPLEIAAATAGQMVLKNVVRSEAGLLVRV